MANYIDTLNKIKAVCFDLDGVVYFGNTPAKGINRLIKLIKDTGITVYFISNNSGKSRKELWKKLKRLAIICEHENIINSGYLASVFLSQKKNKKICLMGTNGLKSELKEAGIKLAFKGPCDYFVLGIDPKFTYKKIKIAMDLLTEKTSFIACNLDKNFPIENKEIMPGCAAIVAAISTASGRNPDLVVGKPNTLMLETVAQREKLKPNQILVIGDNLETDILMANRFKSPSVLITHGINSKFPFNNKPTIQISNLFELYNIFKKAGIHGVNSVKLEVTNSKKTSY